MFDFLRPVPDSPMLAAEALRLADDDFDPPDAEDRLATEEPLIGRTFGNPSPGTTMPKFLARTICMSRTSSIFDPLCWASRIACCVTLSKKSSASCRTCSSASGSMP